MDSKDRERERDVGIICMKERESELKWGTELTKKSVRIIAGGGQLISISASTTINMQNTIACAIDEQILGVRYPAHYFHNIPLGLLE